MDWKDKLASGIEFKPIPSSDLSYGGLLDQAFGVPGGCHYFDDFPVWNPLLGPSRVYRLGAYVENQLIATAGVRLADLQQKSMEKSVLVAVIGAVATRPAWRGRGLASELVRLVCRWAEERSASMALLWSAEYQLYQRLGFEFCGEQIQILLGQIPEHYFTMASKVPQVVAGWSDSVFKVIQKRSDGLVLNDDDSVWYEAHKNVTWYTTPGSGGPTSFLAMNRGIDLKSVIHEWGGKQEDVLAILKFLRSMNPDLSLLGCEARFRELGLPPLLIQEGIREPLCLAKPLRSETPFQINSGSLRTLPLWIWGLDAC